MKSTLFMTQSDVIANFGLSLNQKTLLKIDSVKDFCSFFTSEVHILKIEEEPVSSTGSIMKISIEDFKKNYCENKISEIFNKMKEIIADRERKIEKYNSSNFLNKTLYKISGMISNEAKESSDPEYVQRGIDYLKSKTIEDIRSKIEFVFIRNTEEEQLIVVPEHIEIIKKIPYIFMPDKEIKKSIKINENDFKNEREEYSEFSKDIISKIKVKNVSFVFINAEQPYIKVIFDTEKGVFSLLLNENNYFDLVSNNGEVCFFNYIEAIDYIIEKNKNKKIKLISEINFIDHNIEYLIAEKSKYSIEKK